MERRINRRLAFGLAGAVTLGAISAVAEYVEPLQNSKKDARLPLASVGSVLGVSTAGRAATQQDLSRRDVLKTATVGAGLGFAGGYAAGSALEVVIPEDRE